MREKGNLWLLCTAACSWELVDVGADLLHFYLPVAPGFMSLKAEACPLRHLWQYGFFGCKDNYIKHSPASLYGHPFTKLCFNNFFVPLFTVALGQLQCLSFVSQHLVWWLALFIEQIGQPLLSLPCSWFCSQFLHPLPLVSSVDFHGTSSVSSC